MRMMTIRRALTGSWTRSTGWPGRSPYGSPDLRRLRVGRYRVLYEFTGDVVTIRHIARGVGGS
jgi:hypothetical protein